jgi:hypothetical protein
VRAIPPAGNVQTAIDMLKTVKIHPLNSSASTEFKWTEIGDRPADFTPLKREKNLDYWKQLAELIDKEPPYEATA